MAEWAATFRAGLQEEGGMTTSFSADGDMAASFGTVQKVSTSDYDELYHKPSIEEVTLIGNKTFRQLGLEAATVQEVEAILYLN